MSDTLTQNDFSCDNLGACKFDSPLQSNTKNYHFYPHQRVLYNNTADQNGSLDGQKIFSFEGIAPHEKIFFDPSKINVGIVTCGGLCPGINDVIRSITYCALEHYHVKNVYGFRYGFQGLTSQFSHEAIILTADKIDVIHEQGGTILGSSRGGQSMEDMVDTLIKFNISVLFVIGGDGTQHGSMELVKELNRRKLNISIIGIPKTIDNDISFLHKTFGFDTAVEEARKTISAAHVEAKGVRNGIGLVKLMGRNSGFIAANATVASGNVNICLIPEVPFTLEEFLFKLKRRLTKKDHTGIVVAEGAGQDILAEEAKKSGKNTLEYDKSGNLKLMDIGLYLKDKISEFLKNEKIEYAIKYIDPSYMIRSTPASAGDSAFCLTLGNNAVHAAMAGRTNVLIGYWNQNFCLVPIKLALSSKKMVDLNSQLWRSAVEITEK